MKKKIAIINTHPIQYYAPLYKLLNEMGEIELKVFYTGGNNNFNLHDKGFNTTIAWDIPLLEGYNYLFLENIAKQPGTHHFNGIINNDLINKIEEFNPDVILVYGWAWKSHLKAINYFHRKKEVWFRGDSTLLNETNFIKSFIKNIFLNRIYKKINKAFYVGLNNLNYFKEYGIKDKNLVWMPHAIDNKRFSTKDELKISDLKEKLGVKSTDTVILFAGKFENQKNPFLLLEAFKNLNIPDQKLIFVGNGPLEKQMKNSAKNYASIIFLPFQNQTKMPSIYQIADIYCLPSISETWGLAINEAMAASKPILASNKVGCGVDLIKNGENGYIFESNNLKDLTNKLLDLSDNKNKLREMGKKSFEIIQSYSFEIQAKCLLQEINKI